MIIKPLSEIIEEAREKVARENELMQEVEQEKNRLRSLGECHDIIEKWKKSFFKGKASASIYARIQSFLIQGSWHYQHHISVFRDSNFVELYNVKPEAFDTLTRGLESTINGSIESFTIITKPSTKKSIKSSTITHKALEK